MEIVKDVFNHFSANRNNHTGVFIVSKHKKKKGETQRWGCTHRGKN